MLDEVGSEVSEVISGIVDRITYSNKQNGYTVAVVRSGSERVTVVGVLPFLTEGESADFKGRYIVHPSYGRQFSAESYERRAPENTEAILRYLSSGVIKGVGPGTAGRIVEKFGADSLDIIQNHPEDLALIKGISLQKAYSISEEYQKQYGVRDIMLAMAPYQISPEKCVTIYRTLGKDAASMIKDNPYLLCSSDIDISFEKAEVIASDFGVCLDNDLRLAAGIEYVLRKNLMNGHTCLPRNKLLNVASKLLESDIFRLESICDRMIENFTVIYKKIGDTEFIALPDYYTAEEYIAARLWAMQQHALNTEAIDELEIDYIENKLGIKFEKLQREAVKQAFESGVLILTGGPGTGKTTTLNAIIGLLEERDMIIELAAPTGRAAKRMTELTGRSAKTLHRLLEVEWGVNDNRQFFRNEKNPLDCDVIIVDEASMIDSLLFESLLRALRISCRVILVGDTDQLPSVSAGNVLNDILSSERFASVRLKKVFRQAKESLIITNAHAIIDETLPDLSNKGKDFFVIHRSSANDVADTVLELCSERLPAAYDFEPLSQIQVLCASRKTDAGTVNLNNLLQQCFNPRANKAAQISYKGVYLRTGDKVMQVKNNYDLQWTRDDGEIGFGIFNGDVGFITNIDLRAGIIKVRFDDKVVDYFTDNVGELELAYAITVHKSQGSEFDCVILPLYEVPSQLRYRNLLYTAITRAKKMLIIVGNEEIFHEMAANNKKTLRYTLLKGFIDEL